MGGMNKRLLGCSLALLLTACGGQNNPVRPGPALTEPNAPVVGQALDLNEVNAKGEQLGATLSAMLDPNGAEFSPELRDAVNVLNQLFGAQSSAPSAQKLDFSALGNPTTFGRSLRVQGITPGDASGALPSGTWRRGSDGTYTQVSAEPGDGLVWQDAQNDAQVRLDWKVGGAPTTWAEHTVPDGSGGTRVVRLELPTHAQVSLTRGGQKRAFGDLTADYGACFFKLGPTRFQFSGWAGAENQAAVQLDATYAWTASAITAKLNVRYATRARSAAFNWESDVAAITTRSECDSNTLSIRPSRVDVLWSAEVDGDAFDATLKARDLKNVVFDANTLRVGVNPFAQASGLVAGTFDYNGRRTATAYGELRDGNGNLKPGDRVKVQYVSNGRLVTTDLETLVTKGPAR